MTKEELKLLKIERKENHMCIHCGKYLDSQATRETCNQCNRIGHLANGDGGWRWKLNRQVLTAYNNVCACCGERNQFFLTLDHKEGGGNIHRKEVRKMGSNDWYKWVIENNFPEEFQLLCYNCNLGRERNGGICPHHDERLKEDTCL